MRNWSERSSVDSLKVLATCTPLHTPWPLLSGGPVLRLSGGRVWPSGWWSGDVFRDVWCASRTWWCVLYRVINCTEGWPWYSGDLLYLSAGLFLDQGSGWGCGCYKITVISAPSLYGNVYLRPQAHVFSLDVFFLIVFSGFDGYGATP